MVVKTICAAAAALLAGVVQGQGWKHEVRGFPSEAVEGQPLRFQVAYSASEPAKLHAELKDTGNVVHVSETQSVSGRGVADFSLLVPEGKLKGLLLVAVWFGEDWRSPHGAITHVGPIPVYTAEEGARMARADAQASAMRKRLGLSASRRSIAVVSGGWAGRSAALAQRYVRALAATGHRCVQLGPEAVSNRGVLDPRYVSLVVIPEAQTYPGEAIAPLERYLRGGGHVVFLGAPAFDRLVRRLPEAGNPAWVDDRELAERVRRTPARIGLLDMSRLGAGSWRRSSNDMASPASWRMETDGATPALYHEIGNLSGWDTLETSLTRPGGEGDNLVTFRARGSDRTTALAVEMRERDGSRWIAVTPVTTKWQRHALPVSAFARWDPERKSGRGAAGDHLNLRDVTTVATGLAFTHTTVPGGRHAYWFSDLGATHGPEVRSFTAPTLDTVSPEYKLYPIRGARSLDASASRVLLPVPPPTMLRNLLSTHPRPVGAGFGKGRKYRWIPLLQVKGEQGVAGTIATLVCHLSGPYARGRWASFTVPDRDWYARPDVVRYVAAVADRMLQPPMLAEAGAEFYGYFPDEKPRLGARACAVAAGLSARFTVSAGTGARPVLTRTVRLTPEAGGVAASLTWDPPRLDAGRYAVRVTLLRNGRPVDEVGHEITVRQPIGTPNLSRPSSWVTVENGQFSLAGKPWYPHGVNYMPSSGVAAEDGHYFEQWLSSESYDPVVIERDLKRIREIGFNMVSVFIYTESTHNHNLIDLLNRCDAHGLRVNLSLRPGTPLDFEWPAIGEIIKANRLADDPTVFAYDLAWEPAWGYRDQRRRWDDEWAEWLRQRYGSVENAEKDWGEKAPREGGRVAGPADADVTASSTIPKAVAAYRRFQDDLLSRKHMEARRKIRTLDTRHLLSFRMSIAGDPTCGPTIMPYDFAGLARSMHFMAPEGYGRIGDAERVRPGWFTAAYSRMAAPGRPVLWAEFGYTIWNKALAADVEPGLSFADAFDRRHYLPGTVEFTENYYRAFYDMALRSGSAGTVCWWYPGGFRFGENSDFGIINPDGTWRGLTRIIAENARRFAERPKPPGPDSWITVDRDACPDGIFGLYARVKDEFWRLVDSGKHPGLRTDGDGTDSASAPLIAVGNVPCTGANPPKWLNAEFEYVRVLDAKGDWVEVPYEGGTVAVEPGRPVRVRVLAGNNGIAAWVSGTGAGAVHAVALDASGQAAARVPVRADVPRLGTAGEVELTLAAPGDYSITMQSEKRFVFGERRALRLAGAPR